MENNFVEIAIQIAVVAHDGQKRKEQDLPYISHPVSVALLLAKRGFSDITIAAALVHDVLEDTNVAEEKLREELGEEILSIVKSLSENKALPWEDRKKQYIEGIRAGSDAVKAVSLGDKIHNIQSMLAAHKKQGAELWKKFNKGKESQIWFAEEYLSMMKNSWKHPLIEEYEKLVEKMKSLD